MQLRAVDGSGAPTGPVRTVVARQQVRRPSRDRPARRRAGARSSTTPDTGAAAPPSCAGSTRPGPWSGARSRHVAAGCAASIAVRQPDGGLLLSAVSSGTAGRAVDHRAPRRRRTATRAARRHEVDRGRPATLAGPDARAGRGRRRAARVPRRPEAIKALRGLGGRRGGRHAGRGARERCGRWPDIAARARRVPGGLGAAGRVPGAGRDPRAAARRGGRAGRRGHSTCRARGIMGDDVRRSVGRGRPAPAAGSWRGARAATSYSPFGASADARAAAAVRRPERGRAGGGARRVAVGSYGVPGAGGGRGRDAGGVAAVTACRRPPVARLAGQRARTRARRCSTPRRRGVLATRSAELRFHSTRRTRASSAASTRAPGETCSIAAGPDRARGPGAQRDGALGRAGGLGRARAPAATRAGGPRPRRRRRAITEPPDPAATPAGDQPSPPTRPRCSTAAWTAATWVPCSRRVRWGQCRSSRAASRCAASADGPHVFEARAIDESGRVEPEPARWVFTLDRRRAGDADPGRAGHRGRGVGAAGVRVLLRRARACATSACAATATYDEWRPCASGAAGHRVFRHASRCARSTRSATSTARPPSGATGTHGPDADVCDRGRGSDRAVVHHRAARRARDRVQPRRRAVLALPGGASSSGDTARRVSTSCGVRSVALRRRS